MAAVLLVAACGGHRSGPTQPTTSAPHITCPMPITSETLTGDAVPVTFTAAVENGQQPVNTTCSPGSGTNFQVGDTTVTCTATDSLSRSEACTFKVTVLPPPTLTVTHFAAYGDSITWGEDGTDFPVTTTTQIFRPHVQYPAAQTYPGALQSMLRARYVAQGPNVDNLGKPGEELTDADMFDRYTGVTSSHRYDAIMIMEGSNDANLIAKDSRLMAPAVDQLRQLVRDAKSRGIRPIIATLPPMNPAGRRGVGAAVIPGFNDQIRAIASGEGIPVADVFTAFNGKLELLTEDGLHPNADGYKVIAQAFFDAIRNAFEAPRDGTVTPSARRP